MTEGKLVRDRIPEIIAASGSCAVTRVIEGDELRDSLLAKLREEADELVDAQPDDRLEEVADLLEVVFGLAEFYGLTAHDALTARAGKRTDRGGFTEGVFLERVDAVRSDGRS